MSCPISLYPKDHILLAHGSGGKQMRQLLDNLILKTLYDDDETIHHDGALLNIDGKQLVMTTDSYVVNPIFFSGGDIGSLSVNGTINDLAMCGAKPLYISVALILEEGLLISVLERVLKSIRDTAKRIGVKIVTGDTKVVERGKCDQVYINTTGIGQVYTDENIRPGNITAGDLIILNGDIGRHGMAVMGCRNGITFSRPIVSDCMELWSSVKYLIDHKIQIKCLRDITRGGLSAILKELALASNQQFSIVEDKIIVNDVVSGACEVFGIDPLHVACEGRFVLFVPRTQAELALSILAEESDRISTELISKPTIIGEVQEGRSGMVILNTLIGGRRILEPLSGEMLPRIC
jgi:hydrogenase expression/formation protein HypE